MPDTDRSSLGVSPDACGEDMSLLGSWPFGQFFLDA